MGCPTEVYLGESLPFTITTHDPENFGELTDADDAPSYRVYADETALPILTGTMTLLDDANTTGFYSEMLVCTAENGFASGHSYNIYIKAFVNGHPGAISYAFRIISDTGGVPGDVEIGDMELGILAVGDVNPYDVEVS